MESMTGYGRCQMMREGREITVEIKTVNHRFLDISFRMPRNLSFLEEAFKPILQQMLHRGHADVSVQYRNTRMDAHVVSLDEGLLKAYAEAYRRAGNVIGTDEQPGLGQLLSYPDVLNVDTAEEDRDAVTELACEAARKAVDQVCGMRRREGEALRQDMLLHLDELESLRARIEKIAPTVPLAYWDRLLERVRELGVENADPSRIAQEVALMADHCAIDEELSRLASHITQMRTCLNEEAEAGRKLDFLVQEMNREVNTTGSKASDLNITKLVVAAKSEIEKLREQAQNVA